MWLIFKRVIFGNWKVRMVGKRGQERQSAIGKTRRSQVMLTLVILLGTTLGVTESLKCYKCLNLDCPQGGRGEQNEKLCQSVRSFIVKTMSPFYEIGAIGYLAPCPEREETLQWSLMQQTTDSCPDIREATTCSLGRLQILTDVVGSKVVTSHATILGCAKSALLYYMKRVGNLNSCSIFKQNGTEMTFTFSHQLMLENCPKPSDYCLTKNFCVPFSESSVRTFQTNQNSSSFEAGLIIGIIAIILVLIGVVLLANFCKNPLNRGANYSPAEVQNTAIRVIDPESPDDETASKSTDDVFT